MLPVYTIIIANNLPCSRRSVCRRLTLLFPAITDNKSLSLLFSKVSGPFANAAETVEERPSYGPGLGMFMHRYEVYMSM